MAEARIPTTLAPVPADPEPPRPLATAHQRWIRGRVCPRCQAPIVRGPVEVCAQGHWDPLPERDVPPPPPAEYDVRTRDLLTRGYWLRWGGAFAAAIVALLSLLLVPVLLLTGLAPGWLAYCIVLVLVLALLAVVFCPPLVQPPTPRWIDAEIRKTSG